MLNSSPRQCTVLTKEPCEFLSISEKVKKLNLEIKNTKQV